MLLLFTWLISGFIMSLIVIILGKIYKFKMILLPNELREKANMGKFNSILVSLLSFIVLPLLYIIHLIIVNSEQEDIQDENL